MSKIFLGGSRGISRLPSKVRERIDHIIASGLPVVIGDASGADKAMQKYLFGRKYENVEVFCSNGSCRNNVGGWHVRNVPAGKARRGVEFYSAKDQAMASESDVGLMLWDGKSIGTLANALRLIKHGKKVVLYCAAEDRFRDLRNDGDWDDFIEECGLDLRQRVEERMRKLSPVEALRQSTLFG
jgi:hypothetical protein